MDVVVSEIAVGERVENAGAASKIKHRTVLVPAQNDLNQKTIHQNALSHSGLETELSILFNPNREPQDSIEYTQVAQLTHYHPAE
ncbi:hypothetical protein TNCV_3033451 [Trichonephila clavipes]|nr:hypothetical protein TNCV_3033451 [Trichonephila clavipes]